MENTLSQRFVYCSITPYRNYSRISDKDNIINFNSYDNVFEMKSFLLGLPKKTKKNLFFFTSPKDEKVRLFNVLQNQKNIFTYDTQKDSQIKRHFGNPFSTITVHTIERTIKKVDDKVTVKLYVHTKTRSLNCFFFKKNYYTYSLTLNLKNGNFIVSHVSKSKRTKQTRFRKNSFAELDRFLSGHNVFDIHKMVDKSSRLKKEFDKTFDNDVFSNEFKKIFKIESDTKNYSNKNKRFFQDDFTRKFVELKKIKVPDGNSNYLIQNFYPTEKYLKKNERKLIASILDMFGVKSKVTIKILHKYPNLDIQGLVYFSKLFGKDFPKYIGNINSKVFENSYFLNKHVEQNNINKFNLLFNNAIMNELHILYDLRDKEKENIIKLINSTTTQRSLSADSFTNIIDHINMIKIVREYDPTCEFKAKTKTEFQNEHLELSKIISAIKKGWVIEYVYAEKTINEIEVPLQIMYNLGTNENPHWEIDLDNGELLYPTILKREEEYIEEGNFMHHCVASYANKDKSIIISVRSFDKMNRVTCEYDIQSGRCIQERYFCNEKPPDEFEYALVKIGEKVKKLSRWGLLNWIEKKEVPLIINGKEIEVKPRRMNGLIDDYLEF